MSKMSQLHLALTEEAYDLGYVSLDQALADGWEIDYDRGKLFKGANPLEIAHQLWLKKQKKVLDDLYDLSQELTEKGLTDWCNVVDNAINFIKEGEV